MGEYFTLGEVVEQAFCATHNTFHRKDAFTPECVDEDRIAEEKLCGQFDAALAESRNPDNHTIGSEPETNPDAIDDLLRDYFPMGYWVEMHPVNRAAIRQMLNEALKRGGEVPPRPEHG
jgi:hypothetical protein